nr:hypothetical protein [Tanacetum cinerariifolium]
MMRIKMKNPSLDQTTEEPMHITQDLEEPTHQEFKTGATDDQPIAEASQHPKWFQKQAKALTPDPFVMNRLKVNPLTPELLAGPTYELMKGSCKSLVELEFFLEEVYKATINQLDWNNPEGQQYPHDLLKPLPLIPNSQGRRVIPFDHFINNDLEYLRGVPVSYDKYALYGISHWGRKRQQFYGFAVNREYARDIYSKRRIIAVTELQIVKWHNYKHLDWITVSKVTKRSSTSQSQIHTDYTAYSNPRGFIYQNEDKHNRLMRIDELHKFSDGTLNDVRTAMDDHLKGIQMKYLPQTIWRISNKERAAKMIQAIDKQLKTRRIMRSLEKFVRGRLYDGDFRMLQWTI